MNVGDLKKILQHVPDSAEVGVVDYFGDLLKASKDGFVYHEKGYLCIKRPFFQIPAITIREYQDPD